MNTLSASHPSFATRLLAATTARLSVRTQIAAVILFAITVTVAVTQLWNYRTLYQTELAMAEEKHLVIAKNLSLGLDEYVEGIATVFRSEIDRLDLAQPDPRSAALLAAFDLLCVMLFDNADAPAGTIMMPGQAPMTKPGFEEISQLRVAHAQSGRDVYFSGIRTVDGRKVFHVATQRADGLFAIGVLDATHVNEVQDSIVFGELGHSAIFDQDGLVIGHPVRKLEENSANASGIYAVKSMMEGRTGVMEFYSPPMQLDMITGYTVVPSTGWGVMVPQPVREIASKTNATLADSYLVALGTALVMSAMAWLIAARLGAGLGGMALFADRLSQGEYRAARAPAAPVSAEVTRLRTALDTMADRIADSDAALRAAAETETRISRGKSQFISMLSHELRTPLTGMLGALELTRHDRANEATLRDALAMIETSATRLHALSEEALLFSQVSVENVPVAITTFDAVDLLWTAAQTARPIAEAKGLELRVALPDQATVAADPARLRRVIDSLLENAVNRSETGSVTLQCEAVVGDKGRPKLLIRVTDTGPVIPAQKLAHVFEPFLDRSEGYRRRDDGLGVGLPIAAGLVRAMQGEIACLRGNAGSTVFEVRLPVLRA